MSTALELATEIAGHLGEGWRSAESPWHGADKAARVYGPDSEELMLMLPGHSYQIQPGKVQIGGWLPDDLREHSSYVDSRPKDINVALSKSPERIAAEIKRRLLPPYQEYVNAVKARKVQHDDWQARVDSALEQVSKPLKARPENCRDNSAHFGDYSNGGDIRVTGSDVEFNLRFPHELAVKVAEAIAAVLY